MIIRVLSYLGIVTGIVLEDRWGDMYYTKLKKTPFGDKAHLYPFTKTGLVNVLEDGTCSGKSSYVKRWAYMHPDKVKEKK